MIREFRLIRIWHWLMTFQNNPDRQISRYGINSETRLRCIAINCHFNFLITNETTLRAISIFTLTMSVELPERSACDDDTSSVYSRSPETPKFGLRSNGTLRPLPIKHDLPEINSLDHQISLAQGSTIALETTRARLRDSKSENRQSLPESRQGKLRQREVQERENLFYRTCHDVFEELSNVTIITSQELILQSHFEPEDNPSGNLRVQQASLKLREAVERSRVREARAELEWKRSWNMSRIGNLATRWI